MKKHCIVLDFASLQKTKQGRKLLPCPCCSEFVPARDEFKCQHCGVYTHRDNDGKHTKDSPEEGPFTCLSCLKFFELRKKAGLFLYLFKRYQKNLFFRLRAMFLLSQANRYFLRRKGLRKTMLLGGRWTSRCIQQRK